MSFSLSRRSLDRLVGVHPDLVGVVVRAIEITAIDFAVIEGVRTRARQAELVRSGASQTMHSRHLTGHAVDLAPVVEGAISWHWGHFWPLAAAMRDAARERGVRLVWGGTWGVITDVGDLQSAQAEYIGRRRSAGKQPFLDGPHFELSRVTHPVARP
jgi:peptidoglycan L-alanyl-D-glutamate endopeptidase CwlK